MGAIYALVDPRDDTVRYVGATMKSADDRLVWHLRNALDTPRIQTFKCKWIRYLLARDLSPTVRVLEGDISDEPTLFEREQSWIIAARVARWPLTNATDGGDFPPIVYQQCDACEMVTTAGSMQRHQVASGHVGISAAARPDVSWLQQRVRCDDCGIELLRCSMRAHQQRCAKGNRGKSRGATIRHRCGDCERTMPAGPLGRHQQSTGHRGRR